MHREKTPQHLVLRNDGKRAKTVLGQEIYSCYVAFSGRSEPWISNISLFRSVNGEVFFQVRSRSGSSRSLNSFRVLSATPSNFGTEICGHLVELDKLATTPSQF